MLLTASASLRRRAARAGAPRQDGVSGAAPRLLGGPGRPCRRVRALVPDVPAHQGGARRPARAPSPAAAVAAQWNDWIAGLPTTVAGFDVIQNPVDLLSGKVHAVPTRSTATATADAAVIIRDICLRSAGSGVGLADALVVDHDANFVAKFTSESEVFRAMSSACACASSSARPTTRAPTPRRSGPAASSATLCAPTPTAARTAATAVTRSPSLPCTSSVQQLKHRINARRPLDAFLHRPRPPSPNLAASPRNGRRQVAGGARLTARSGSARWRRRCGSCSRRRRQRGRRRSTRAGATRHSRSATALLRTKELPRRMRALPSTSIASNQSLSVPGPRRPRGP